MPVTRHQGDARLGGAPVSLDPSRYANFKTAGCSKCRFSGCRACRGYTLREYQAFLDAKGGPATKTTQTTKKTKTSQKTKTTNRQRLAEVVDEAARDDTVGEGGKVVFGGEQAVTTLPPVGKDGGIRQGCGDGSAVGRGVACEARGGETKVGCSKCRFRGCKKCRGYTLAELRAREASEMRGTDNDGGKQAVGDVTRLFGPRRVGWSGTGRKRSRNAISRDDAFLGAGDSEMIDEGDEGAFCKKKRWAVGAFSGLRAKVISAVFGPLNALSSLTFWSRSDVDGKGSELETGEGEDGGAPWDGIHEVDPGKCRDAGEVGLEGMAVKDNDITGEKNVGARRRFVAARHAGVVKHRRAMNAEPSMAVGAFPHLLARPNRMAPPRARPRKLLRKQVGKQRGEAGEKENVEPEGVGEGQKRVGIDSVTKSSAVGKTTNRRTRMRNVADSEATLWTLTCKGRRSTSKAAREDSPPRICVETPATAAKTPAARETANWSAAMVVNTATDDDMNFKARKTRLSAAKVSTKGRGPAKGAGMLSDPPTVVETPAVHDERSVEKGDAAVPDHAPDSERLPDECAPARGSADRSEELVAGVDANADTHANKRQTQKVQEEQHSTPTPEVSFSFADMAGASKDTISADQFHQYSQDEQGSLLTSASGLSPLRLPGAVESDFAFAEALQAFSSPEHDQRAVTRAMDVVGNLMLDLDVSPDAKNCRQSKTPGKHGYLHPAMSPTVDFVDPNSSSPALSPVTFVLPDAGRSKGRGNKGNASAPEVRFAGNLCKGKPTHDHPISSMAADQGSLESAKHLLKKNMVLKQASQDALYMKVREVIINRHLMEIHRQGHDWATLDACGVPLDASADHVGIEAKVLGSIRKEYGDDTLHRLVTQVEEEWKLMYSVRQKYSKNATAAALATEGFQVAGCYGNNGTKTTPTRSILRQQRSSERLKRDQTLRWASENVEHTYTLKTTQDMDEREKESGRLPSSTRGLRMLGLASASPKGGPSANGSAGKVSLSPMPPSPTGLTGTANTMTATTPGGSGGNIGNDSGPSRRRSRTQNVQNTGTRSSQGQRLFQALQNASQPDWQQPSSTPRTLAMIFDSLPDNGNDHSNNTSSVGPTNSDTTTSSNSSRGSGGGGRWEQTEVECLIRGFKEWACLNRSQYVWKYIGDTYRGNGLADCRTNDDLKSKWKAMRKTVGKNRRLRYVKLTEDELEFLRSEESKP